MNTSEFAYWLQGWMELESTSGKGLTAEQTQMVREHLAEVFTKVTPPLAKRESVFEYKGPLPEEPGFICEDSDASLDDDRHVCQVVRGWTYQNSLDALSALTEEDFKRLADEGAELRKEFEAKMREPIYPRVRPAPSRYC